MKLNPTSGCGCCEAPGCITVPCCGNGLPRTMTVTDSRGKHKIGWSPTAPGWIGKIWYTTSAKALFNEFPPPACFVLTGDVDYSYWLQCAAGNVWRLTLTYHQINCEGTLYATEGELYAFTETAIVRTGTGVCDPFSFSFDFTSGLVPPAPISGPVTVKVEPDDQVDDLCCAPCPLPKKDLVLSWANVTTGNDDTTFTWNSGTSDWTACVNGNLKLRLYCSGGTTHLDTTLYASAGCTGTINGTCNYPGSLVLGAYSCTPVSQTYTVPSSCTAIYGAGYRTFTITEAAPPEVSAGPLFGRFGYNEEPYGVPAS